MYVFNILACRLGAGVASKVYTESNPSETDANPKYRESKSGEMLFFCGFLYFSEVGAMFCVLGWVDIGIGTKGMWGFVVSLEKVWEIAKKFL
jgi:hypothetical protein